MAIVLPLKRLEIGKVIAAPFRNRYDVINFPTVVGCVAMARSAHPSSAGILTIYCGVLAGDGLTFSPHSFDGCRIEGSPFFVCVWVSIIHIWFCLICVFCHLYYRWFAKLRAWPLGLLASGGVAFREIFFQKILPIMRWPLASNGEGMHV